MQLPLLFTPNGIAFGNIQVLVVLCFSDLFHVNWSSCLQSDFSQYIKTNTDKIKIKDHEVCIPLTIKGLVQGLLPSFIQFTERQGINNDCNKMKENDSKEGKEIRLL